MKEWAGTDAYNPFNSMKLLAWADHWRPIQDGQIPVPVAVSVDPANRCNQVCVWCNAGAVLAQGPHADREPMAMSEDYLLALADFLARWGVRAVCVGGGGEPLTNPHTGSFIARCAEAGVEVGMVTNGTLIDAHLDALGKCRWVGVSVDAATPETYARLHQVPANVFGGVMDNIRTLQQRNAGRSDFEIGFKYLVHPDNLAELFDAAQLAKGLGVARFHSRPVAEPWFRRDREPVFTQEAIRRLSDEVRRAYELQDRDFRVYCITHKLSDDLDVRHRFARCRAVFMSCVFEPGGIVSLCCDRRGDPRLVLCRVDEPRGVEQFWGSEKHLAIAASIHLDDCPRCTFAPHNEIFEQVIERDAMMLSFI